ncbi:hypothetical protein V9L05_01245 [Bernardetia sp. Wsw4-3y2]|uniref:hypothetical protein n=1 Tax=Bernardetia sp. Wsw4-3y2 TaxID=3127471 RepID=UPI0030CD7120
MITRYPENEWNFGGICEIRILKRCDFQNNQVIIERYRGTGTIKISANDELLNVFEFAYHTYLSALHDQKGNTSQHGYFAEQGFSFAVAKNRHELLNYFTQLQDEPLTVLVKSQNDTWRVIGTEEDWALISASTKSGQLVENANEMIFEVRCASRYLAPFLEFEKREEVIVEPTGCFESGEGFSHNRTYPIERRMLYNYGRFDRVGTYKLSYSLDLGTRIIIRYNSDSSIIDDRTVQPSNDGFYTFTTNGQPFLVIVEKMNGRRDTQPYNSVGVAPPCLPSP